MVITGGLAIAGGVMSLVSGAASIFGGMSASKDAKRAAKEEAGLESIITQSKVVDLEKQEEVLRGQTVAAAAGAGVKTTKGSPLEILAEQAREFAREKLTVQQVGASRASAAMTRGKMVGRQAMYQGVGQGVSALGSAFSMIGQSGSYLGKQPGKD